MCEFDKKLLSYYLDNELSADLKEKVELHLEKCSQCKENFNQLGGLNALLTHLEKVDVSSEYEDKFRRRFEEIRKEREETPAISEEEKKHLWDEVKSILTQVPVLVKVTATMVLAIGVTVFGLLIRSGELPTIITAKGEVEIYNIEAGTWSNLRSGMRITEGNIIRVKENSFLDIEQADLYKIRIKQNSIVASNTIIPSRRRGITSFILREGEMLIKIYDEFQGSEFIIETPLGEVQALGTGFMVDMDKDLREMWLKVLDGEVQLTTSKLEDEILALPILVKSNYKLLISEEVEVLKPQPLDKIEIKSLEEINRIGKIMILLYLSDTPQRVRELLTPARLYAYGKYPVKVARLLDEALILMSKATRENNVDLHLRSIDKFVQVLELYPVHKYNPQILLFIGAYYEYLSFYKEAVEIFDKVVRNYSDTKWASIALCAKGIIQEEKLKDFSQAEKTYLKLLSLYPDSLEAKLAKAGLQRLQ